ncbi:choice-of-anchor D domain-containing protein [Occallatibacter savannae]|uniref:choice-of-anchor D domain-containing protein n=1 Tax=Occallatibacter savannae TaxID=1002691 RepID=UPI000D696B1A|nr:choice-of-anchor D domain-containing protein [Occallatibacter savannae]
MKVQSAPASTAIWQPLGPTAISTPRFGLVSGRVTSIAIDPADPTGNHVFIGTTGGGVWSSQNAASSANVVFSPLTDASSPFDSLRFGSISIGAVSVQPGSTGVILAGTGDPNDALDSYYGSGILRSTDNGSTWSAIPLTADQKFSFMGEGFARFAWSTTDPQLVVAAVAQSYEGLLVNAPFQTKSYAGLYYSTDAGATWSLSRITDGPGKDVQGPMSLFAGPNGNSATAVVWNPIRQLFIAAVRFHGYYQSADGITWTRMAAQPGTSLTAQLCPSNLGSIGSIACPIFRGALAVNPVSGDTFAWSVDLYNQDQGLWQDTCALSGGACSNQNVAFAQRWSTAPLQTGTALGPVTISNGDYDLALAAVPSAQDTILLAGANDLWRCSLAMGCSWRNTTNAYSCASAQVAPYQHALAWNPSNPQEILLGNDSGLWRSLDGIAEAGSVCSSDDQTHFQNLNGGLGSLAEVDSISQVVTSSYTMMAGFGANGTAGVKNTSGPTEIWPQVLNGEGGPIAIDPANPTNWYVNSSAGVAIHRCSQPADCTADTFVPVVDNADVAGDGYTMTTPAPFIIDPLDSSQILLGTCRIWRGPADGTAWTSANAVSPFLDGISGRTYCSGDALVRSIAALPISGGGEVIYVGMFGSLNGGAILGGHILKATLVPNASSQPQWTDLTLNPVANSPLSFNHYSRDVSSIYVDPHDPSGNTVYATVAGMSDIFHVTCTVYRTVDGGAHWYEIVSNLRSSPANSVVVDPQDASTVYVATDAGVYSTRQVGACIDGASNCWSLFGTGLPYAPVTQLSAAPGGISPHVLVAGTYGRGIWQIPLWTANVEQTSASLDPTSLTFAPQSAGSASPPQTITLTNNGAIALAVSSVVAEPPFNAIDNCVGKSVNEGQSCTIQVSFAPVQLGPAAGNLTISGNVSGGNLSVALAGTGTAAAPVTLSPAMLDFGQVAISKTSSILTVSVQNASTSPVALANIAATAPFSVAANPCGTLLAANSSCALSIAFTPTQAGQAAGTLTVSDDAGTQSVYLKGSGAAAPTDTLTPSSLAFSTTAVGQQSTPQVVELSNTGDMPLNTIGVSATDGYHTTNSCSGSLGAHSKCSISVSFAPSTPGSILGTLTVSDAIRSQTVQLSGTAVAAPSFKVSSIQVSFGTIVVGQASSPMPLTITNTGSVPISNVGFQISGSTASSFSWGQSTCGDALQAASSCTVQLTFAPVQTGQLTATLVVSSSTPGVSSAQVTLTGLGQGNSKLVINPSQLSFVQYALGRPTSAQAATVTNYGEVTATQMLVAVSPPFSLTQNTCGASLGAGATCSVGVLFTPTVNGTVSGTLSVNSAAYPDTAIASLLGIGGAAGAVQVSPSSMTFPTTGVGISSASRTVTVTNTGPVALSDLTFTASAGFQISSTTCGAGLDLAASCNVQVIFKPTIAGQQSGNLSVSSRALAAPAEVAMSGMGFDFSIAASGQASKTVASGQSATYLLVVTPANGSAGTFTLSCGSLPVNSSCSFNPASELVPASGTGTVTLNIATGGQFIAATKHSAPYLLPFSCLVAVPIALKARRRKWWLLFVTASLFCLTSCVGSGGGGGGAPVSSNQKTPAGTYSVDVSAAANGLSHKVTLTLIVD